jgi:hypothetical protein
MVQTSYHMAFGVVTRRVVRRLDPAPTVGERDCRESVTVGSGTYRRMAQR